MSVLYLSLRTNYSESRRIPLNDINLDDEVKTLKQQASQEAGIPAEDIVLTYRGNILEDESTLVSSGLQPGVTVIVLGKVVKDTVHVKQKASIGTESLLAVYKIAVNNPNYRAALQRLCRPEVLENLVAATPGLREDPIAMAIVEDAELLSQLITKQSMLRVMTFHPALADAFHSIMGMVPQEAASPSVTQGSAAASYSLDALSDDDDVDSQSSDSQPHTRNSSFNASITSAQLAAALAAAQAMSSQSAQPPSDTPAATPGLITSEMFSQALGQAVAASTTGPSSTQQQQATQPSRSRGELTDLEATSRRLAEHLQQMRELGLRDDTLNLQALQATDWNVQEAINLVFSGVMNDINDPDESLDD